MELFTFSAHMGRKQNVSWTFLDGKTMKQIPLKDKTGKIISFAIVDEDVYPLAKKWNWCLSTNGFVVRSTTVTETVLGIPIRYKVTVYLHMWILNNVGTFKRRVFFINGDKKDCRKQNLTYSEQKKSVQNNFSSEYSSQS